MSHRDDTVIVFRDKKMKIVFCRICACPTGARTGATSHSFLCRGWYCRCSYKHISSAFDNTRHEIILSDKVCRVCELNNHVCEGREVCPPRINFFLDAILKAIKGSRRDYSNQVFMHIHRYNITCSNPECKNYNKLIGRALFSLSCPLCGQEGHSHSRKCKALPDGEIRCVCRIIYRASTHICGCKFCRERLYKYMKDIRFKVKSKKRGLHNG